MLPLLLALAASGQGATGCASYLGAATPAARRAAAALVQAGARRVTAAGAVDTVMSAADWRLVWATPAGAEPGVFLFRRRGAGYRLVDIWGGVALAAERADTAAWARTRGVPSGLAGCFADRIVDGTVGGEASR